MKLFSMRKTHGMSRSRTYRSWSEMKRRCGNPENSIYKNISYCERWKDFNNFFSDMGERPEGTSLDRINTYGNYEPSNCRWADKYTQSNNRKNSRKFIYRGEEMTLSQIARKYNISRGNLANKIYINKMDITKAVEYLINRKAV